MALITNVLVLSQIAGNAIIFILSICILVPMALHLNEFSGHCLLFSTGEWREDDGLFNVHWASTIFCGCPIFTSVFLFITSNIQIYRLRKLVCSEEESGFLGLFLDALCGAILCALTLISAIMITLGFIVWCSGMTQRFPSCEIAAGQNITREDEKINTSGFYVEMGTSQFGAWSSFAISVGILVIALLKLINNHQLRNMRVSMYLERHRLMNEDVQIISTEGRSTPPIEAVQNNMQE